LLSLLNGVLDLSKIEASRLEIEAALFKPAHLIKTVMATMKGCAQQKGLELTAAVPSDVPATVLGDELRIRQVLLNLIGNALKFTEAGGVHVTLEVESLAAAATTIRFSVADTGIGIPEDKRKIIFEPFRQADGSVASIFRFTLQVGVCAPGLEYGVPGQQLHIRQRICHHSAFCWRRTIL
jgi:two-component system, sensor histidine kinase